MKEKTKYPKMATEYHTHGVRTTLQDTGSKRKTDGSSMPRFHIQFIVSFHRRSRRLDKH